MDKTMFLVDMHGKIGTPARHFARNFEDVLCDLYRLQTFCGGVEYFRVERVRASERAEVGQVGDVNESFKEVARSEELVESPA